MKNEIAAPSRSKSGVHFQQINANAEYPIIPDKKLELKQTQELIDVYQTTLAVFARYERKATEAIHWYLNEIAENKRRIVAYQTKRLGFAKEASEYKKLLALAYTRKWKLESSGGCNGND